MKKNICFACTLFIVVAFIAVILPLPGPGQYGAYNSVSGWVYCSTHDSCLHEIGHALDQQAGWVSDTAAFRQAVQVHILTAQDEFSIRIVEKLLTTSQVANRELYASMFAWSGGQRENMPDIFHEFYDWPVGECILEKLNGNHFYTTR